MAKETVEKKAKKPAKANRSKQNSNQHERVLVMDAGSGKCRMKDA